MGILLVSKKVIMMKKIKFSDLGEELTDGKVLVLCSATWCGPCKAVFPMVEDIVSRYPDVPFLYVVTDARFHELDLEIVGTPFEGVIRSFPSLFLMEGKEAICILRVGELEDTMKSLNNN